MLLVRNRDVLRALWLRFLTLPIVAAAWHAVALPGCVEHVHMLTEVVANSCRAGAGSLSDVTTFPPDGSL